MTDGAKTRRPGSVALAALALAMACTAAPAGETAPGEVVFEGKAVKGRLTDERGDGWRGVNLFIDEAGANCVACHENPDVAGTGLKGEVGPTIGLVGEDYGPAEFRAILVDARRVFGPDTAMPAFYADEGEPVLTAQQIEDIVAYLMELRSVRY